MTDATRHVECLIIGAGLVGSITSWILARQGYSGVLVDRSADPGGVNGSFTDRLGNVFDHGRHIILADRDDFTARFFSHTQHGRVREFALRRGIVVRGHLIPYAAPLDRWPEALASRIPLDEAAGPVRLGSGREEIARVYGRWFADLAFDEMLDAFPPLRWQRARGRPEETLMRWVFPWFFPRSGAEAPPEPERERGVYSQESRDYHYRTRHSDPPGEVALYPTEGGFVRWIESMLEGAGERIETCLGASDVSLDFDADTLALRTASANGTRYTADRVFWCAPLPVLCRELGWKLPDGEPQVELLGNFAFRDPLACDRHEVLIADPRHLIRRVNLPELFAGRDRSRTVQVEFTTPRGEFDLAEEQWLEGWRASLVDLGLVDPGNEVRNAELHQVSRGIVTTADLNAFVAECRARLADSRTNLVTPHLAAASDNNSRLVPNVFRAVYGSLLGDGGSGGVR